MRSNDLRRALLLPVIGALVWCEAGEVLARPSDAAEHRKELLRDVSEIHKPGIPGPIALVGDDAFAVLAATARGKVTHAVVAAATYGKGRVVAFGHDGYLSGTRQSVRDTPKLVLNAVRWAGGRTTEPVVGLVDRSRLRDRLEDDGLRVRALEPQGWAAALEGVDVLVITRPDLGGDGYVEPLRRFVREGGGLVTAGLAWGWMQLNPRKSLLRDHALNRALAPMGLFFADGYVDSVLPASTPFDADACHALRALARIEVLSRMSPAKADARRQMSAVVGNAYRWLPAEETAFRGRVRKMVAKVKRPIVPTKKRPVRAADIRRRLALVVDHVDAEGAAPEDVRAADSAADFPGAVPEKAPRVKYGFKLDLSVPGWVGGRVYAPPGEVIEITPGPGVDLSDLRLRIGCHSDRLWGKAEWRRHPQVSSTFALGGGPTRVASPHGGLIYFEVPEASAGPHERVVYIDGVSMGPTFKLGVSTLETWREISRDLPGPWAELTNGKITLTVPSSSIRKLDDPAALLEFWDGVLDLYAELGRRPLAKRPQRIVADRQISVGWMHAGYPIMIHMESVGQLVSLAALRDMPKSKTGAWGFWHELGHNHQHRDWTFGGTTEVTCNLFSLFVDEKVRGIQPIEHAWPKGKDAKAAAYIRSGSPFARWKREPGIALWMYILVQDAFGWDAFQRTFAEYAALPDAERPKTDDQKRDQWLVRLSRAVERDLGPYFEAWGVPTSETARKSVADLDPWMPKLVADALSAREDK